LHFALPFHLLVWCCSFVLPFVLVIQADTQLLVPTAKQKFIAKGVSMTKLTKKIITILSIYDGKQENNKKNKPIPAQLFKAKLKEMSLQ
jgi:hypothetical protein